MEKRIKVMMVNVMGFFIRYSIVLKSLTLDYVNLEMYTRRPCICAPPHEPAHPSKNALTCSLLLLCSLLLSEHTADNSQSKIL